MVLLSLQAQSLERSISKINYLDIFISKTGNKWNTTISRGLPTGIIYFMQPVTVLRHLKEVYVTVHLRSCRISDVGSVYAVKMDDSINKSRKKEKQGEVQN